MVVKISSVEHLGYCDKCMICLGITHADQSVSDMGVTPFLAPLISSTLLVKMMLRQMYIDTGTFVPDLELFFQILITR